MSLLGPMTSSIAMTPVDDLMIAVRAYVPLAESESPRRSRPQPQPSDWVLIFDTETTTDPSQRLRFGSFQLRYGDRLEKNGLFYDPETLSKHDQQVLARYACANRLELLTRTEWIEKVFFRFGYDLRGTIVGFNLPFDISRLAIGHNSARRRPMRGGFSFLLSEHWCVVSNNRFTAAAEQLAATNGILLLHYRDLKNLDALIVARPS
jgi:hypothetical protein